MKCYQLGFILNLQLVLTTDEGTTFYPQDTEH